jgi:DNA helicase HerA-like ATPase
VALIGQAEEEVQVTMSSNFRDETGKLMTMDFDKNYVITYLVWFDYTKRLMKELRVGDLLAVPNFADTPTDPHLSVLTVSSAMPFHYAAGKELSGYPLFLEKVREEAFKDFYNQDDKSSEETTKIEVRAAATDFELTGVSSRVVEATQIPITGGEVKVLLPSMVEGIFNQNLGSDTTITLGKLTKGIVDIKLKVDDLVKTHFAVFGYTGTGKSNLVSTIVSKLLASDTPIQIVVFDLMGEYVGLLADVLLQVDGAVAYLEDSLPDDVLDFLGGTGDVDKAAKSMASVLTFPPGLRTKDAQARFVNVFKKLLKDGKIQVKVDAYKNIGELLDAIIDETGSEPKYSEGKDKLKEFTDQFGKSSLESKNVSKAIRFLDNAANESTQANTAPLLNRWVKEIKKRALSASISGKYRFHRNDLINQMAYGKSGKSLYLVESDNFDSIRDFAFNVVAGQNYSVYSERRKKGKSSPLALFIFDEADDMIPPKAEQKDSLFSSARTVETIARRGRKFGMGVAIATQRVVYLDTNIMAQPHTYFVSKLPRETDRTTVTGAFGIPEDMLRETFKFKRGDWLVISHEATGLTNSPIPVHSDNAEERIKSVLAKF